MDPQTEPAAPPLSFVIVGHVDHGKSTLIGRLLYQTGSLPQALLDEVREISEELGREIQFAYLLDALEEERERNVTIDTTQRFFGWRGKDFVIIDAPGHREFLKNMVTGASGAEAAILVIDVSRGLEEQTRRHAFLLGLLGIKQVAVAANKMDLVDHSREAFEPVRDQIVAFLEKTGVGTPQAVIPISASEGDNIESHSEKMPWYKGPTILEAIAAFRPARPEAEQPARFSVQDLYEVDGAKVSVGLMHSGRLSKGDALRLAPGSSTLRVTGVKRWQSQKSTAEAGDCVGLTFAGDGAPDRGAVLCAEPAPRIGRDLAARVFWMAEASAHRGDKFLLRCATQEVPCEIVEIRSRIDSSTLEPIEPAGTELRTTEVAVVTLRAERDLVHESFHELAGLGRFILMRRGETVAGGIFS